MTPNAQSEVVRDLFLHWARHSLGRDFRIREDGVSDGEYALDVHVRPLVQAVDPRWEKSRRLLEELIGDDVPARVALWIPAGASIPAEEPEVSEFADLVRKAAIRLGPGERSHVELPIALKLRKSAETGGVMSVTGGLNPHWARFTDRVRGTFDLDSTALNRLPESEEFLETLLDTIVERASALDVGAIVLIETTDNWTIQRLDGDPGFHILGLPVDAAIDLGMTVRRNFRRILVDEGAQARASSANLKALVVVGQYSRIEFEGATTAMRGYDPASYSGIDFVCLGADGIIKPLVQPPANALPWTAVTQTHGGQALA